jgi:hypothetical protein
MAVFYVIKQYITRIFRLPKVPSDPTEAVGFSVIIFASYVYGIARNHPFVDGNKRTALVLSFAFLESNGWEMKASEEQAVITFFEVASGAIDEKTLAKWSSQNSVRMPRPDNTVDRMK